MGYYYQMPGYQQQPPQHQQHHGGMAMHGQLIKNNPYVNPRMQPQGHYEMQQQPPQEIINPRNQLFEQVKEEVRKNLAEIEGKE
jgi:hypothetical protein